MASFGLCLKLTHLEASQGSLHLSDITDGVDVLASFRKAGPVYVPFGQQVTLAYTGSVAISFETGAIRGFIDRGLLAAEFLFGPTFLAAFPGGPPSGPAGGDLSGTYPNPRVIDLTITGEVQGSVLYYNGTNWVQLPPGTSGQVLTTNGAAANPSWETSVAAASGSPLIWGNDAVAGTTTTRYLSPGFDNGLAQTTPVQFRITRDGTLRRLRIVHNTTAGNGNTIVYTIRVNNVATAITVSLASTASAGSDLVNTVAVLAGDYIDIVVTKAASIATSPTDITASLELA